MVPYVVLFEHPESGYQAITLLPANEIDSFVESLDEDCHVGTYNPRSIPSMIAFGQAATKENAIKLLSNPTIR